jgi:hypothetical protein
MFGLSRPLLIGLAALGCAAAIALGVGMTVAHWRGALDDARTEAAKAATEARDAHWRGEIARSNQEVAEARLKAAEAAMETDRIARAAEARETHLQAELEKANAALPDAGAIGLSRDRVCLLSPAGCANGAR